jgi:hypothetical protein
MLQIWSWGVGGWDKDGMDMHVRMYLEGKQPMGRPTIY